MYRARHFRWIARQALKGFWALTIGITLVASLLGGTVVSSSGTSSGGFHFRLVFVVCRHVVCFGN